MKKNFNEQKGKPNGKGRKNKASDTAQKNKNNQPGNDPTRKSPLGSTPDSDTRKNDPTGILHDDPWKETETSDRNNEKDRDKGKQEAPNQNPLKGDPTGKMPSEKSVVTDPTIDENIVNDSLF